MSDRMWDFEDEGELPSPTAPPIGPLPNEVATPVPGTSLPGVPPPRAMSPGALPSASLSAGSRSSAASGPASPPAMPGRAVAGPQRPPQAGQAFPATVASHREATSSLAPVRPPRPGERLLHENPSAEPPPSRWGWRAFAAFLAGGVLAAIGFGIGTLNQRESALETAGADTSTVTTGQQSSIVVTPPDIDTSEPAAFVADILGPSIVQIETTVGLGSGVVFQDGLIMTNQHVIAGAGSVVLVRTSDGRAFEATVVGGDPRVDIAVLDVGVDAGLPVATLAVGEVPVVGQVAIAIGSPFQLQQTVTSGIVSALNRPVPTGESAFTAMLQTDTAINPGNSGGALADRSGRVIGIITAIQTDGTRNSNFGVGFAVPIDTAVRVAERILEGDPLEAGFLGVAGAPVAGESGVVVTEVTVGSGAEAAGLMVGDRVISLNAAPVTSLLELAGLVQSSFVGDVVEMEVIRDGETIVLSATLGSR